jgi:hypothetical protein
MRVPTNAVLPLVGAMLAATASSSATSPPGIGVVSPALPLLRNAFALGTLVRFDPSAAIGEFKVSCGWFYAPRRRLRAGLWKVPLRGLKFGWESNTAQPGSGHVVTVSLGTWEHRSRIAGWSGSVRLRRSSGDLSNGPTTDICGGVPG